MQIHALTLSTDFSVTSVDGKKLLMLLYVFVKSSEVMSNHLYLYSTFNNTDYVKAALVAI